MPVLIGTSESERAFIGVRQIETRPGVNGRAAHSRPFTAYGGLQQRFIRMCSGSRDYGHTLFRTPRERTLDALAKTKLYLARVVLSQFLGDLK